MQSRKTLFSVPGGDTIQIVKTSGYLRKSGIEVDISLDLFPDLTGYDIVHLFNITRVQEVYCQIKNAKRYKKPVALSTIFIDYSEYERNSSSIIRRSIAKLLGRYKTEYLKILMRGVKKGELHRGSFSVLFKGYYNSLREICKYVDIFLPNSEMEMVRLKADLNLNDPLYVVVPNGVDTSIFDYDKVEVPSDLKKDFSECILSVGRIEELKCQLNLVRAVRDLPYKLVIIGKPAPNHYNYYEKVKREAGSNVYFLPHLEQQKLAQFYKLARVHALISWFETTGLSSLEAAAMKCNLVITDRGYTTEYFRGYAFYCNPDDPCSIREAIVNAYNTEFNEQLYDLVMKNYTWEVAARKTLSAYEKILGG